MSAENGQALLEAARALVPSIRESAAENEKQRKLPQAIVEGLAKAGILRMSVPRALGGAELDPLSQLAVIEELAKADASTGWCAMIAAGAASAASSLLPPEIGREIWSDPDVVVAGVFAPSGVAQQTAEGYRLSGRWRFASFSDHARWITVNTFVTDDNGFKMGPGGPETRTFVLARADVQTFDTWHVLGMRGTGSHDIGVNGVLVPAERSYSLLGAARHPGPLYAFRPMFLLPQAIVALATARTALERILAQDRPRKPAALCEMVAQAEALISSGRAYLLRTVGELWETLSAGTPLPLSQRAQFRSAFTTASTVSMQAMDLLFSANGGGSIYCEDPIERAYRDVRTMTTHGIGNLWTYETIGAMLLGTDPAGTLFGPTPAAV